jgi:hypothetical protein
VTRIEILYFEGCPNHPPAAAMVRAVVAEVDADVDVVEVEVRGAEDAERLCFLGSPTIRVDGGDVEPRADERTDYAMSCRVYPGGGVASGSWLERWLRLSLGAG